MAERQLKPTDVVYPCVYCLRPFGDRSNRRRHVTRAHPGVSTENLAAIRSSSSAASSNTLSLRHMVAAVTEDVLKTNFTRPSDELVSTIRTLAPSLSLREAEVLLAATSAAVKHTSGLFQTLNSLRQAGGPTTAAERDLTRQLAYLSVGPRWPRPSLNDDGSSVASLPEAAAPGQLVENWLAWSNEGFATAGGVTLPELSGAADLSPPPPPPPSSASSTVPVLSEVATPEDRVEDRSSSPAIRRRPREDRPEAEGRRLPPSTSSTPSAPPGCTIPEDRTEDRSRPLAIRRRPRVNRPEAEGHRLPPSTLSTSSAPSGRAIPEDRAEARSRSPTIRRRPRDDDRPEAGEHRHPPSTFSASSTPQRNVTVSYTHLTLPTIYSV